MGGNEWPASEEVSGRWGAAEEDDFNEKGRKKKLLKRKGKKTEKPAGRAGVELCVKKEKFWITDNTA